jgi:cell division protein FtsB
MRIVVYGMLALLVIIQYPLWLGKGGWLRVYELTVKCLNKWKKMMRLPHVTPSYLAK